MARRWRWPPDRFEPPWRDGRLETARACADEVLGLGDAQRLPQLVVGRVGLAEAEVAGDRPAEQERLLRDEADASPRGPSRSSSRTSTPSIRAVPAGHVVEARDEVDQGGLATARAADDGRGLAGPRRNEMSRSDRILGTRVRGSRRRGSRACGRRRNRGRRPGSRDRRSAATVARTSLIRSADTTARGTMTNMNTAIITANRICMTYCRKAMRLPIGISPLSTRRLPNHRIATDDRLKMAISSGIIRANSRLTRSGSRSGRGWRRRSAPPRAPSERTPG